MRARSRGDRKREGGGKNKKTKQAETSRVGQVLTTGCNIDLKAADWRVRIRQPCSAVSQSLESTPGRSVLQVHCTVVGTTYLLPWYRT